MVTALERTFGFELEVADGAAEVARSLHGAGLAQANRLHSYHCHCEYCDEYFGNRGNWFKVQRDSSCGGEVISSILKWGNRGNAEGRSSAINPTHLIDGLARILVENDTPLDRRCGLHVHVGARDLSDHQLGRLYALMHHHEAILYRLACGRQSVHRGYDNNFNYCRPMSAFDNPVELKELARLKTQHVKSSPIAYNKYIAANLMPIETLGTVEFRLYESTRSRRRMRFYAKLSVALVQRAKRRRNPVGPALPLGAEADDGVLLDFLADLQEAAPELVNDEFIEDANWQWEQGPARWQPGVTLPPLPHRTSNGTLATTEDDDVVEQYDSHDHTIHVPPEYDLDREERERRWMERNTDSYRRRVIPPEYRDQLPHQPNYDCASGGCPHGICRDHRVSFWHGVAEGNVRAAQPRPLRREPEPVDPGPAAPENFSPALNDALTRVAERMNRSESPYIWTRVTDQRPAGLPEWASWPGDDDTSSEFEEE